MTQMVHLGPVRIFDLRDKLRLQPTAFTHLFGGQSLTPDALVPLRQVRKAIGSDDFSSRSDGIDGRPITLYISSNSGERCVHL
jgi:hypothetical protein